MPKETVDEFKWVVIRRGVIEAKGTIYTIAHTNEHYQAYYGNRPIGPQWYELEQAKEDCLRHRRDMEQET